MPPPSSQAATGGNPYSAYAAPAAVYSAPPVPPMMNGRPGPVPGGAGGGMGGGMGGAPQAPGVGIKPSTSAESINSISSVNSGGNSSSSSLASGNEPLVSIPAKVFNSAAASTEVTSIQSSSSSVM